MLHVLTLFVVYLVPAAILFHFAADTFFRNPSRSEFQLGSLALLAVMMMFVEEFIRQLLPISYSAQLVAYAFGNFGALSAAFVIHFYFKISGASQRIRPWVYIPLSYILLVPSLLTLILQRNIYNSTRFYRVGIWIQPIYNTQYYIAISVGIAVMIALTAMTCTARIKLTTPFVTKSLRTLSYATILITLWHIVFGIFPALIPGLRQLPPYPYIFGDLVWMTMLRWAMSRQEFLPPYGKQYKTLFNLVPAAIVVTDTDSRILEANPIAQQLFGESPVLLTELLPSSAREDTDFIHLFQTQSTIRNFETELLQKDGSILSVLVSVDFVQVDGNPLSISVIRDITDRKRAEQRVEHLAYYDSLTDLPNRPSFYQLLESAVAQPGPDLQPFAVILVDIDGFKEINDSYGHQAGDHAIQHVAATLRASLQSGDVAARLGGDEFVLMLRHASTRAELVQAAVRLVRQLHSEVVAGAYAILMSASVGVAFYPDHGRTPDELVKSADMAMYEAKQSGKNRFVVFGEQGEVLR